MLRNFFEENPGKALALALFLLAAGLAVGQWVERRNESARKEVLAAEGNSGPQLSERMAEVTRIMYRDPDAALTQVEAILQAPSGAAEAEQARQSHALALQLCFHKRLNEGSRDAAHALMEKLRTTYPESFHLTGVLRKWAQDLGQLCREQLKQKQMVEAKRLLQKIAQTGHLNADSRILAEYQDTLIAYWKGAGAGHSSVDARLLSEAASVLGQVQMQAPLVAALRESQVPGEVLVAWGDEQPGGQRSRAIPFYQAAIWRLNEGRRPWFRDGRELPYPAHDKQRAEIDLKQVAALLELGDALAAGRPPVITHLTAEEVFRDGAQQLQTVPLRAPLLRRLVDLQTSRFMQISEPIFAHSLDSLVAADGLKADQYNRLNSVLHDASSLAEEVLRRSGAALWTSLARDEGFDPWPLLDPAVRAEFAERRRKGEKEELLRQSLASKANHPDFRIPVEELEAVRQRLCEIHARRGLLIHRVQPAECVNWVRRALAGNKDPQLTTALHGTLVKALLNSRDRETFNCFYELTSFVVSDIGLENVPPLLRNEFTTALGAMAELLAKAERPKAIFLWAIQAEASVGEQSGHPGRRRAIEAAFQLVAVLPSEAVEPDRLAASGLPGFSVASFDNSTEHHLLIFYQGAEAFFVACPPYRKASAVMRDGSYEIAVIAPSGAIEPYHGKVTLNSHWLKSNYHIGSSKPQPPELATSSSRAAGEYQLARVPAGGESFEIDVRTGAVRRRGE